MSEFMRIARFFNFEVSAIVTDMSGESHEGVMSLPLGTKPTILTVNLPKRIMSLPLGTKPTILTVNLPKRIETDSLKTVTFAYRNASGMPLRLPQCQWYADF